MIRFKQFLKENYLFEAKESVINRYKKLHKDHNLGSDEGPDKFHDAIRFSVDHGQSHDERMALAKWTLSGHLNHEDDEDAPTARMILGRHRGAKAKGKLETDHQVSSYNSPFDAIEHLDTVSPVVMKKKEFGKSPIEAQRLEKFKDHKIGNIQSKTDGSLDVYHFHHELHGEDRVKQAQKEFIKPACGKSVPWCVVQGDAGATYMHRYSRGQGFLYYTKKDSMHPMAAHGNNDGVRNMSNQRHEDHKEITKQTNNLLPIGSKEQIKHGMSTSTLISDAKWKGIISASKDGVGLTDISRHPSPSVVRAVLKHSLANSGAVRLAAKHKDASVVHAALGHPKADSHTVENATDHKDASVVHAALGHSKVSDAAVLHAAGHKDPSVAHAALKHPKVSSYAVERATQHKDPSVVHAALGHSLVGSSALYYAARHKDASVVHAALKHSKADPNTVGMAAKHEDASVAHAALGHSLVSSEAVERAAQHEDPSVAHAALGHPRADSEAVGMAAKHEDPSVARAALGHPKADSHTVENAVFHKDASVAHAALKHPLADVNAVTWAAIHKDASVVRAALGHPLANSVAVKRAAQHEDPSVARAARDHPYYDKYGETAKL